MSLRVWLPLNGDLENKGLDGNIFLYDNTGAIVNENGKIGKCYYFDGVDDWIRFNINKAQYSGHPLSFAAWVKCGTTRNTGQIIDLAADLVLGYNYDSTYNTIKFHYWRCYKNSSGVRVGDSSVTTLTYSPNKWYHVVSVFDKNLNKIYVDGELSQSFDSSSKYIENWQPLLNNSHNKLNIGKSSGDSNWGNIYVNDVRIYDHALSLKQVQQISKGLILHYKLDNNGMGNFNILLNTHFDTRYQTTGWDISKNGTLLANSWGGYNAGVPNASTVYHAHLKNFNGEYVYEYIRTANESWLGISQSGLQTKLVANKTYTFSWQQYCVSGNNYITTGLFYFLPEATSAKFHLGFAKGNISRKIGEWQKFTYTFTAPDNADYSKNMSWYIYGADGGQGTLYLRHIKLEEGNISTPWCLAKSELIDSNIIYDSSGYQNDGTIIGNVQTNSDSPKYTASAYINSGSVDYIISQNVIGNPEDAITMNIWFKSLNVTPGSDYHEIFNFATYPDYFEFAIYKTGFFRQGMRINGTRYVINGGSNLLDGNWHMLTATYDGINIKRYIDGKIVPNMTQTVSGTLNGANGKFLLGHYGSNTSYYAKDAYLSDARIYATALSEEDIKELYQTSVLIDRNQNLYVGEVIE